MMLKFLAMAAMLNPQTAPSAPSPPSSPPCVTREQINDISIVAIAATIETTRNACRSHLPATAWLVSPAAAEYSARFRAEAERRFDSAFASLAHSFGGSEIPPEMLQGFRRQALQAGSGTEYASYLNPGICADANEIIEITSVLSPEQTGRLFGAFASLVDNVIRIAPPGVFGPEPHPPGPPRPPAPPAATPTPPATPAAFEFQRRARRPTPPPAPEAASAPILPFMCRTTG